MIRPLSRPLPRPAPFPAEIDFTCHLRPAEKVCAQLVICEPGRGQVALVPAETGDVYEIIIEALAVRAGMGVEPEAVDQRVPFVLPGIGLDMYCFDMTGAALLALANAGMACLVEDAARQNLGQKNPGWKNSVSSFGEG